MIDLRFDCGRYGEFVRPVYVRTAVAGLGRDEAVRQCREAVRAAMLDADGQVRRRLGAGR